MLPPRANFGNTGTDFGGAWPPDFGFVPINSSSPGLSQVANYLNGRGTFSSIGLFGSATAGKLSLGSSDITVTTLNNLSPTVVAILQNALNGKGTIYVPKAVGSTWINTLGSKALGENASTGNAYAPGGIEYTAIKSDDTSGTDFTPPTAKVSSIHLSTDSGTSGTDLYTQIAAQTISGTLSGAIDTTKETLLGSLDNGSTWTDVNLSIDHTNNTFAWGERTLLNGITRVKFKVSDRAHNDGPEFGRSITLDTTAPSSTFTVSSITVAGDGTVNAAEAGSQVIITGTTSGAVANDEVRLTINGSPYAGTVSGGTFSIAVNGADLANDPDKKIDVSTADRAGNTGTWTSTKSYAVDTARPTVSSVTDNVSGTVNTATSSVVYTYTFNKSVTGLILDDFSVANGSISSVSGSGTTWTVNVTPAAPGVASGTIGLTLKPDAVSDTAGNQNDQYVTAAQAIDTLVPTLTITSSKSGTLKAGDTATITFDLSEESADFTPDDIVVTGGSLGSLTQSATDHSVYTAVFTPAINSTMAGTNKVDTGKFTDAAGNSSNNSATLAFTIDTEAPTIASFATTKADGSYKVGATVVITATASEAVPIGSSFVATLNSGGTATLTAASEGKTLTGTYTVAAGQNSSDLNVESFTAGNVTDIAGNTLPTTVPAGVNNLAGSKAIVIDTTAPTVTALSPTDGGNSPGLGANLVMTFGEAVTKGSSGYIKLYKASGTLVENIAVSDSKITVSGNQVSINPNANLINGQAYYVKVDAGAFIDSAGNSYAGITTTTDWNFTGASLAASINPIAGNNKLNAVEADAPTLHIGGSVNGDALALDGYTTSSMSFKLDGQSVTLTNLNYTHAANTTIAAWSADIATSVVTASEGNHVLMATFTGTGTNVTAQATLLVDTVAPAVPTLTLNTGIAGGATASEAGGAVKVTGESLSTIAVTFTGVGGQVVRTLTGTGAAQTALLSLNDQKTLSDGTIAVSAVVTDPAGNSSAPGTISFVLDTKIPSVSGIALSADTGIAATDFITNIASQTIRGTLSESLASGDVLYGSIDGGSSWTNISSMVSGTEFNWTGATLSDSGYISIKVTDTAGNSFQSQHSYVLDTAAPTITVSGVGISADTGSSNSDFITNASDQTITGRLSSVLASYDMLYGSVDNGVHWTDITSSLDADDPFQIIWTDATLAGSSSIVFKVGDFAGNTPSISGTTAYTLDTVASAPTISIASVTADNVLNASEAAGSVTLTGTTTGAADGDAVKLVVDGTTYSSTVASNAFSIGGLTGANLSADSDKVIDASVTSIDTAGNTGTGTSTKSYTVDTTAPSLTVGSVGLSADTGTSSFDFITKTAAQTISGTLSAAMSASDILYGSVNNGSSWTNITGMVSGTAITWTSATLAGSSIVFKITDAAGNDSNLTGTTGYTLDTAAPSAPTSVTLTPVGGTVVANTLNASNTHLTAQALITAGQATGGSAVLKINGVAVASDSSIAADDTTVSFTTSDDSPTNAELQTAIAAGGVATVELTDAAGNTIASSVGNPTLTRDMSAPSEPIIATIASNNIINLAEADSTISGTCELAATVHLNIGGNNRAAAMNGTAWSYTLTEADIASMGQGIVILSATQTDTAGNTSAVATYTVIVDTTIPAAPFINPVASNNIINVAEAASVITGTCEAGATVALGFGGNYRSATVNDTDWSYALAPDDIAAMGQGGETLNVTQTDAAGNVSTAGTHTITIDTVAPSIPIFTVVAGDDIINASEQATVISGTCEAGATVVLSLGGNSRTAIVTGTTWNYTLTAADIASMNQGAEPLGAIQTDAAGNDSAAATRAITVDTVAPAFSSDATSTSAEQAAIGTAIHDATADGDSGVVYALTGGADVSRFSINPGTGQVSLSGFSPDYEIPVDSNGDNVYAFIVRATDTAGNSADQAVAITITNANDPGFLVVSGAAAQEQTLTATLSDADGVHSVAYQWQADGSDIVGATGSTLLLHEEQVDKTITVRASYTDDHNTTESVISSATGTIANVNDAPDLVEPLPDQAATEGTTFSFSVPAGTFHDPDAGSNLTYHAIMADGSTWPNWLTFSSGSFSGSPGNADVGTLEIKVIATDEHDASQFDIFSITVNDVAHAPKITSTPSIAFDDTIVDDVFAPQTYIASATDPDDDPLTWSIQVASSSVSSQIGTYGTLTVAGNIFTYAPNDAAIEAAKMPGFDDFTICVRDGTAVVSQTLKVMINAADDPTSFGGTTTATLNEDGILVAGGTLTRSDRDAGDAAIVAQTDTAGTYGHFSIASDGVWSYSLNCGASAVQALKAGHSASETFTVLTAGGASRNIAITVNGANDAPTFTVPAAPTLTFTDTAADDSFTTKTGTLDGSDVDAGTTLIYGIEGGSDQGSTIGKAGLYGSLTLSKSGGAWSYAPNEGAIEALKTDTSDVFVVTLTDGSATTSHNFSVSLIGVNDTPRGTLFLDGTPTVGQLLAGITTSIDDAEGVGIFSYQWQSSSNSGGPWTAVAGATEPTYVPVEFLVGQQLRLQVAYIDSQGSLETIVSDAMFVTTGKLVQMQVYAWKTHTLLDAVNLVDGNYSATTDAFGAASFNGVGESSLSLTAERLVPAGEGTSDQAVNLQDAIAILKMIVGLEVNGPAKPLSPYQAYAADFDGSGTINLSDAIGVLKHVVGLNAPEPHWEFFNETNPIAVPNKLVPGTVPALSVNLLEAGSPVHVGLVGVLRGDVDGNYAGLAGAADLDQTQPGYFNTLASAQGLNLSQFGIY